MYLSEEPQDRFWYEINLSTYLNANLYWDLFECIDNFLRCFFNPFHLSHQVATLQLGVQLPFW